MISSEENAKKIQMYIEQHPSCELPKRKSVTIKGKNQEIPVYKIPLDLLYYNIKNGRFAAQYLEKVEELQRELEPFSEDDKKIVQKLLLDLDPKKSLELQENIFKLGQTEPAICSFDGQVYDGNRRMSVIQNIRSLGNVEFNFLEVGILNKEVDKQDFWFIEAGIQFARDVQVNYGPINTLLKFREGINLGLAPIDIAKNIFGYKEDEKAISEKIEILILIEQYLIFIGQPNKYLNAEMKVQHFIDLNAVLKSAEKEGFSINDCITMQMIGFQLIHDGLGFKQIRKLKNILQNEKAKKQMFEASKYCQEENPGEKQKKKLECEEQDIDTPTVTIFNSAIDEVQAKDSSDRPMSNLSRAYKNLENISPLNETIKSTEFQEQLQKLLKLAKKLEFN